MNFRLIIVLLSISLSSSVVAQMTGIAIDVDTAFYGVDTPTPDDTFDVLGELDGYVTYQVYAEFTNPTDVLSAIYSDITASTLPVEIETECGCFDPLVATFTMDPSNSSFFWDVFPFWEYDSYWTIGMESANATGVLPLYAATIATGSEVCSASISDGAIFSFGVPVNAIAGDDLRVLIAQITTCGDWCFSANFQVFVEGDQQEDAIQYYLLDEQICTVNPCEPYLTQESIVTGAVLPCAGGSSTVEVEFLGLGDPTLATYSLLDQEGAVIVDSQDSASFDDLSPGNYSMVLIDEFFCRDTTTFEVTAPPPPIISNSEVIAPSCSGLSDGQVMLSATGGTGSFQYSENGNIFDGVVEFADLSAGDYTFYAQDENGCVASLMITIPDGPACGGCIFDVACNYNPAATILDDSCYFVGDPCDDEDPNTLDDEIQEDCECAGTPPTIVDEFEALSVLIYPNPASNYLTIDLGDLNGVNTRIKLYDSSSKLVFEKLSTSTLLIDVSIFAKGLYTLELSTSDKVLRSQLVLN